MEVERRKGSNLGSLALGAYLKAISKWNPILEEMERKLSSWKRLYLSKGGGLHG